MILEVFAMKIYYKKEADCYVIFSILFRVGLDSP